MKAKQFLTDKNHTMTELYSYDDEPFDVELKHFSIERDKKYIIPMIKEILKIKPDLFLFASPWSPPGWMKTGGNMCGGHMPACIWHPEIEAKFIKILRKRLDEEKLNVAIWI